jgi:hypothetical protein
MQQRKEVKESSAYGFELELHGRFTVQRGLGIFN